MAAFTSVAKMVSSIASISKMVRSFIKPNGSARWKAASRPWKAGCMYVGTEQGDLYCLNMTDGSTIWKVRIGVDSDSTPAVLGAFVYTAAEDV